MFRHAVMVKAALRISRLCGFELPVGRHCAFERQAAIVTLFPPVDLWLEQIDRPAQRQDENERKDEQAGIEMPAPDRTVGRSIGHGLISP